MIESVLTIVGSDGQESRGGQALVESVGKRVTDPGEIRLTGTIVERENKHHVTASLPRIGI